MNERKPRLLYYSCLKYQPVNRGFLEENFEVFESQNPDKDTPELLSAIEVICAPLGYKVTEERLQLCHSLKYVLSNTTGVAHIDVDAAKKRGVEVCALHDEQEFLDMITPTAEHTIGLLLAAWRRIPACYDFVLQGHWDRRPFGAPRMLSRMRLGLIGYGRLGKRVGDIAGAMGMKIAFFDPYVAGGEVSPIALARKSDVLSIHAIANEETRGLISREVLSELPRGSMVVNTARGEILDTDALVDLMESGHIYAAGLDVLDGEFEPNFEKSLSSNRVLNYARKNDRLVLTPHTAGSTLDAWYETERFVIEKVIKKIRNER